MEKWKSFGSGVRYTAALEHTTKGAALSDVLYIIYYYRVFCVHDRRRLWPIYIYIYIFYSDEGPQTVSRAVVSRVSKRSKCRFCTHCKTVIRV